MSTESVEEFYDRQYRLHEELKTACPNSLHDLAKAQRRVMGALRGFNIKNCSQGAEVLDVGCGLGCYTKALSMTGANVTGMDFSEAAIQAAKARFPECHFFKARWHEDIGKEPRFDLIWTVNFSLINTFDVQFIHERLVAQALPRLKPGGCLVVGWNSNLSGRKIGNYSQWSLRMLRRMREVCGFSAPIVPEASTAWLSRIMIGAAYITRRSIPIFMARIKVLLVLSSIQLL